MRMLLIAFLLVLPSLPGRGAQVRSLDGEWLIATDPNNIGREQKWFDRDPVEGGRPCRVPDVLERTFPGYDGVVWYWRSFDAKPPDKNERLLLRFHAADYQAEVWVNGVHAGSHEGGETPFSLDITRALNRDGKNRLVVRLLNPSNTEVDGITLKGTPYGLRKTIPAPGQGFGPISVPNVGGLWQSVELLDVPAVRVDDVFADARLSDGTITTLVRLANDTGRATSGRLHLEVAPASGGPAVSEQVQSVTVPAGKQEFKVALKVPNARPWSPDDPYLYWVSVRLEAPGGSDLRSVRCGFREFVFRDGYFRLNGKRLLLRGVHTGAHFPIGLYVPHDPELLRRELLYAKAMGFNLVRWLARTMYPSQLDFCDELGLMVHEENYASWGLADSPKMRERFDRSIGETILRDRNHPSIVMWGMLNETPDGPVFRHAVEALSLVRSLDPSRMALLNSGRYDRQPSIGSLSNPRTSEWQYALGSEAPDAPASARKGGSDLEGAGDIHLYVGWPLSQESLDLYRTLGSEGKNVYLSEQGSGSQMDPVHILRLFEQNGARPDLEDAQAYRYMYDQLERDWKRWRLDRYFTTPSDMFAKAHEINSQKRLILLNAIRSNPKISAVNVTQLSDLLFLPSGLLTIFRELKPGVVDALTDALAPLRWSLFVEPVHLYRGATLHVEAVLANEDALKPGDYPVRLRIVGPTGGVFEKASTLTVPDPASSPEPPMVFPVFREGVVINGPAGSYDVAVLFDRGAAAVGKQTVIVGDPALLPRIAGEVTIWDNQPALADWLRLRGLAVKNFDPTAAPGRREVILVGGTSGALGDESAYRALAGRVERGSVAVFLAPAALGTEKEKLAYLPVPRKGELLDSTARFWGRDDLILPHPIFEGLPSRSLMDLVFYRDIVPSQSFSGFDDSAEVVVPSFMLVGHPARRGYWAGANLVIYRLGEGEMVVSTLRLLQNLGRHPAADRIVLNLVSYGIGRVGP